MKSPLSSIGGSKYTLPLPTQIIIGISLVALGFTLVNIRTTYLFVLLAGLTILPIFLTRLSVHLFAILLFLEIFLLGVFSKGTFTVLGLRAGFFDIFILISTFVLFLRLRERVSFKLLLPFMVYLLLFLLSVLFRPAIIESGTFYWQLLGVENLLILILALLIIESKQDARILLGGVAVLISFVALYFLYRYWTNGQITFGGMEDRESLVTAFPLGSTYSNKNSMAAQILPAFIMLTVFAFELKSRTVRVLAAVVAMLIFMVILTSASRGAAISAVGGTVFYLFVRFRSGRFSPVPLLIIGLVGVTLAVQTDQGQRMLDRLFGGEDTQETILTDFNRMSLIRTSAELIKKHPVLGIGFDEQNFMMENEKYNFSDKVWAHPHNSYLHMWVFGGTLTFLALLWVGIMLIIPIRRALRTNLDDPFLLAASAAVVGLLIDFATDRTFFIGPVSHLFFVLLASTSVYAGYLLKEDNLEE
jgi:O-antigen ligase